MWGTFRFGYSAPNRFHIRKISNHLLIKGSNHVAAVFNNLSGIVTLQNRLVMSPMTRNRATGISRTN